MIAKRSAAVLSLLVAGLAGCGGEDSNSGSREPGQPSTSVSSTPSPTPAPSPDPADVAIAEASVLLLSDFPAGWEASAAEDDDDEQAQRRLAECVGVAYEDLYAGDAQASAVSMTFVAENDDEISNSVAVTADEARAQSVFEIIASKKYRECALQEMKSGLEENAESDDDFEIGDVTLNEVSVDSFGNEATAFRITASVEAEGLSVDFMLDYVIVRVGRAATTVTAQSTFTPFDSDELAQLVAVATDRLTSELL